MFCLLRYQKTMQYVIEAISIVMNTRTLIRFLFYRSIVHRNWHNLHLLLYKKRDYVELLESSYRSSFIIQFTCYSCCSRTDLEIHSRMFFEKYNFMYNIQHSSLCMCIFQNVLHNTIHLSKSCVFTNNNANLQICILKIIMNHKELSIIRMQRIKARNSISTSQRSTKNSECTLYWNMQMMTIAIMCMLAKINLSLYLEANIMF